MTRLKIKENIFAKGIEQDLVAAQRFPSHSSARNPKKASLSPHNGRPSSDLPKVKALLPDALTDPDLIPS